LTRRHLEVGIRSRSFGGSVVGGHLEDAEIERLHADYLKQKGEFEAQIETLKQSLATACPLTRRHLEVGIRSRSFGGSVVGGHLA
jgi:hypothetical protein